MIVLPIKDDRSGSLRTECLDLPPGKAGAAAARAAVDELARDLGELHQDARLLVSELVTAGAESLEESATPHLEISISRVSLRVELRYEGVGADAFTLDTSAVGEWTRMLLDALTSSWGTSTPAGVFLWFELQRA